MRKIALSSEDGNISTSSYLTEVCLSKLLQIFIIHEFDTAAAHHFCRDKYLFVKHILLKNEKMTVTTDGVSFPIVGKGVVKLKYAAENLPFRRCDENLGEIPN